MQVITVAIPPRKAGVSSVNVGAVNAMLEKKILQLQSRLAKQAFQDTRRQKWIFTHSITQRKEQFVAIPPVAIPPSKAGISRLRKS